MPSPAVIAWGKIVDAAGNVYYHNLMMGVARADLAGHWKDELILLENGLKELQKQRENFQPAAGEKPTIPHVAVTDDDEPPEVKHNPITSAPAGKPLIISAEVSDPSGVKWIRLRYRSVNQYHDFQTMEMLSNGAENQYQAEVPGECLDPKWDFMYLIEAMDVLDDICD